MDLTFEPTLIGQELQAKVEELRDASRKAHGAGEYSLRCVQCQTPVFMAKGLYAVVPGHIYSQSGVDEFGMTRMCEHCFDRLFMEPDAWLHRADEDKRLTGDAHALDAFREGEKYRMLREAGL